MLVHDVLSPVGQKIAANNTNSLRAGAAVVSISQKASLVTSSNLGQKEHMQELYK